MSRSNILNVTDFMGLIIDRDLNENVLLLSTSDANVTPVG